MWQKTQRAQVRRTAVECRLTNWPVIVLLFLALAVVLFDHDAVAWREALNPQVIKPLVAAASLVCLLLFFFIGSDGLRLLLAIHVLASVAVLVGMLIERQTGVPDFIIEVVRRGVYVVLLLSLCLWAKDREAKTRSTASTSPSEDGVTAA